MISKQKNKIDYFDSIAPRRQKKRKINRYYWKDITQYCNYFAHNDHSVLEIGCGTGELLNDIKANKKVGIDYSPKMIENANPPIITETKRMSPIAIPFMVKRHLGIGFKFWFFILLINVSEFFMILNLTNE